jgi:hypothetical protein
VKALQKNSFLFALGFALLGVAACGDDSTQKGPVDLASFINPDMSKIYMCVQTCTTDDQCANSCAPPTNRGSSCCDSATTTCFTASTSTCPAPLDFSVTGPY